MKETIFDLIEEPVSEGKQGYFDIAAKAPQPKDDSWLNQVADYGKTILKGTAEGVSRLGRMMGPLETGKPSQKQFEEQTEALDTLLPTDEGYIQKGLRRGLKEAPSMIASPLGGGLQALPRSIAAGFAGEGAKELGLPEWAQTAAELTAYITPDITKKLLEKGSNAEIIAAARKLGMSDEAITPLLQSSFKQKWLSKLTPKHGATKEALGKTKEELSNAYSTIQKSSEAAIPLSEKGQQSLMKSFGEKLFNMPAAVRNKIREDFQDLINRPITGETLINFYSDVNHYLGENAKQLSLLKEPIKQALTEISPKLGKDFETVNKLYTKFYPIQSKLKPTLSSEIVKAAETVGLVTTSIGALFGYYPPLMAIVGEKAASKIAQQMLINPHFQQIGQKMVVAINQNKFGLATKLFSDFKKQIADIDPKAAEKFENFTEEEFKELLNLQKQKQE